MQQKYEPHIRVKFSLFDSPQFRMIPNKHRAYCYLVFICLLKFANSKTLTCYPRQATLSSMTGLSRSTIYRITEMLERSQIITKKRQKSTTLYIVDKIASKYSIQELNEAIKDNDNPYLCKKALEIKDQEGVKYVSKDVINKAVDDVRKKTNYFYRDKVYKNKREHGRISATKSFLSRSNKKK
jgi:DNA-binding IscR family transcriptional regulator